MTEFEFKSDSVFYLWARGFVFHGIVKNGEVNDEDKVVIKTKNGNLYAKVSAISNIATRTVINKSIKNEKIAIMLSDFSNEKLNNIHERFNPETDKEPESTDFLNVEYQIIINGILKIPLYITVLDVTQTTLLMINLFITH